LLDERLTFPEQYLPQGLAAFIGGPCHGKLYGCDLKALLACRSMGSRAIFETKSRRCSKDLVK
jgi:hypothetical protein